MKHGCRGMLLVAAALLGACGGDDEADGNNNTAGGVSLGVSSDTVLSSLSASEAGAACQSLADSTTVAIGNDGTRALCVVSAYATSLVADGDTFTLDVAKCNTAADSCVSDGGPPDDADAAQQCASALMGCGATAGEVDACGNEGVAVTKGLLAAITCENLADIKKATQVFEDVSASMSGAACSTLFAKCEDLDIF